MEESQEHPSLTIHSSDMTFNTWLNKPYIGDELREVLTKANVMIVPDEGYADLSDQAHFPSGTEELLYLMSQYDPASTPVGRPTPQPTLPQRVTEGLQNR